MKDYNDIIFKKWLLFFFRYKDGRAYPWPSSVSNFILYPESANQTIYTTTVTLTDTGNYTCLLRNDTHIYSHTIHLIVFGKLLLLYHTQ